MKKFEESLAAGPALVLRIKAPAAADPGPCIEAARRAADRAAAFLVGDSPGAAPCLCGMSLGRLLADQGLETIVAMNCRDRNRIGVMSDLLGGHALGLRNVLAVSGDHALLGPMGESGVVYDLDSVQLIDIISGFNQGRWTDGRALETPTEFHPGGVVNPEVKTIGPQEIKFRLKAAAGARYFFSAPVYNPDRFLALAETARELKVKLLAGLRLYTPEEVRAQAERGWPGVYVPEDLRRGMEAEPDRAPELSLQPAARTVEALKDRADGYVLSAPGLEDRLPDLLTELGLN